jgi:hypothetical protein
MVVSSRIYFRILGPHTYDPGLEESCLNGFDYGLASDDRTGLSHEGGV